MWGPGITDAARGPAGAPSGFSLFYENTNVVKGVCFA